MSPHSSSRHSLGVQNHLLEVDAKKAPAPGWDTIRYMVAVVQYGGRITDEYDKLLMDTLAVKYFQQVAALWSADIELTWVFSHSKPKAAGLHQEKSILLVLKTLRSHADP